MLKIKNLALSLHGLSINVEELVLNDGEIYVVEGDYRPDLSEMLLLFGGILEPTSINDSNVGSKGNSLVSREVDNSETVERLKQSIFLNDQAIYDLEPDQRAQKIGFIFENPDWSILAGSVQEDFFYSYAAASLDFPSLISLKKYGIYNNRQQKTFTLSGGEKHRLNCACVLEHPRNLLICDLSSSNLDSEFREDLIKWISKCSSDGTTVIFLGARSGEFKTGHRLSISKGEVQISKRNLFGPNESKTLGDRLKERFVDETTVFVELKNAWGKYTQSGFSFKLVKGAIAILEGQNGVGKTTLAKMISNKESPIKGTIEYSDTEVLPLMAFQHPEHCFLGTTVMEELPHETLLLKCGINTSDFYTHPRGLSRPQQKLLSIASSLYYSRKLSILDEPTCGLDFKHKLLFVDLLNEFLDLSILIINHDPAISNLGLLIKK